MDSIVIEPMTAQHRDSVRQIYGDGIATGLATFETSVPEWDEWDKAHRTDCRLVALAGADPVGWAALSNVSGRCVYSGVAEVSIYVATAYHGRKIGDQLLKALIKESESAGIWTLQAGIFPENKQSLRLHERNGFRVIGVREKIGKLNGTWRDVVLLERRSQGPMLS